jgi:glycosyltransferase involved in cell wall biosynthesis
MRKVYAASDIVLALSKDGEAFGRVPAEAAAHGRVAIATAMGATPELIIDGVTGLLVPPNDPDAVVACCLRVFADGDMAGRIGTAGMEHVARNFHPDTIARQVEAVYESLLKPLSSTGQIEGGAAIRMKESMKSDNALTRATVVFMDKSRLLAGAERCLCVLTEHLDKTRFRTMIAADYPLPHHTAYQRSGVEVRYRTTGVKWWMGTDRWRHPPRGTDAIKRIIFARQLRNMMTACDARILHVNLLSQNSRADFAAARRMGMRTVGHVRSLLSQRLLDKRCLELCDVVICISDYVAREIIGLTEASQIVQIYDPVSLVKMVELEERNNAKDELGLNADAIVISSVAMLDPRKGHDVAILAFAKLLADFPNAMLLIVGGVYEVSGNTEWERLQKIAIDSGVGSRVVFSGYVSEMRKVYAASDIVLALSKDGEAFGLVPAEAAAHGRVAIATAMGATPELIIDGVTGFLVPPNDPDAVVACCRRVLTDSYLARRIGLEGMEHVARKFHPGTIARQIETVYDRLLQL